MGNMNENAQMIEILKINLYTKTNRNRNIYYIIIPHNVRQSFTYCNKCLYF